MTVLVGDRLTKAGETLTARKWLPNAGFTNKGKWLLANTRGITCQLSLRELTDRGFRQDKSKGGIK